MPHVDWSAIIIAVIGAGSALLVALLARRSRVQELDQAAGARNFAELQAIANGRKEDLDRETARAAEQERRCDRTTAAAALVLAQLIHDPTSEARRRAGRLELRRMEQHRLLDHPTAELLDQAVYDVIEGDPA